MRGIWGFAAQRRAATAVMMALIIMPVLGLVALAVDVGVVVWARAQLDLAADAAALTAVMAGTNAYATDPEASFLPAQQAGVARFQAQAGAITGLAVSSVGVAVTRGGGTISATVDYAATSRTYFAGLFGFTTLPAAGHVTAARQASPFLDFRFLLDASASMAIPATEADITRMGQLVRASPLAATRGQNEACAFACHFDTTSDDFLALARRNDIDLRIDVLARAVQGVITTLSRSPTARTVQAAVHSFDTRLTTAFPLGANLAAAAAAARSISLPLTPNGDANSNSPAALQAIGAITADSGDGSGPEQARQFLFIITDGVADYIDARGVRVLAAFDPAECAPLKARGVQILVLYTRYIPLPENWFYTNFIAPFISSVAPNLQACASRYDYYSQASDPASITLALQNLLQAALAAPARITR